MLSAFSQKFRDHGSSGHILGGTVVRTKTQSSRQSATRDDVIHSSHEVTHQPKQPSHNMPTPGHQDGAFEGLEVTESNWGDWDQACEECAAKALRGRLLNEDLRPPL